jgi:hypothetical protein
MPIHLLKIVSGGQTGVDRAALDVALEYNFPCGGWCPRGRIAEDGPLAARYPLIESPSPDYEQRTEWNVRDADGTLILARGTFSGGTALTVRFAERLKKPCLVFDLNAQGDAQIILDWLNQYQIRILNVAGPRQSQNPGIYSQAYEVLRKMLINLI